AADELVRAAQSDVERQRIGAGELEVGSISEVLVASPCAIGKNLSDLGQVDGRGVCGSQYRQDSGIHQVALVEDPPLRGDATLQECPRLRTRLKRELDPVVGIRFAAVVG